MATLRQFKKGETIKITITPESGVSLDSPILYVYPDNLSLSTAISGSDKIIKVNNNETIDGKIVFSILPDVTRGENMPAGDYTIELKYGNGNDISIVSQNHAFTLVDSGFNVKESI